SLISREDVIVVASVSSIYGLGSPEDYKELTIGLKVGAEIDRDELLCKLVDIQYERTDVSLERGKFRVRGDSIDVRLPYEEYALRVELWGDEIEAISFVNPVSFETIQKTQDAFIYPAKHFVLPEEKIKEAIERINEEMNAQVEYFRTKGQLLEAQRLLARTRYDMELMQECGFCPGIENYSAVLEHRAPGEPPNTLFDFFPDDFLLFVDESHVTLPQIHAMYAGDRARKKNLVDHGFRLPSAYDNRPLKFEEWEKRVDKVVYVSATPGEYELEKSQGRIVEQVIRPTGLLDPIVEVVPATIQISHLHEQILERAAKKERVLVTALTKRLAEDVASYFVKQNVRCKWLHSELDAFERVELLRDLRSGEFDVLVGVNLLREGLDLPEVSLVAILDADKEGFLRSETSLIQTIGRSARNVNAKVILYADKITESMRKAMVETERRRQLQQKYNEEHGITPETVKRGVRAGIQAEADARERVGEAIGCSSDAEIITLEYLDELEKEMLEAADNLEFETAARLRDRIEEMREKVGELMTVFQFDRESRKKRGKRGRRGYEGRNGPTRIPKPEK
ncbi:MAG: excinuclease ABC subunit UvrB, partial [Thermoguttaceae bacterium]|nr:excinuclease ABC subunit UvrB [Thermoguttaceae bacterium]